MKNMLISLLFMSSLLPLIVDSIGQLRKYEEVIYEEKLIENRVKRSPDSNLHISFSSYGRKFNLLLVPIKSEFKEDFIETINKNYSINKRLFYEGVLINEKGLKDSDSSVSGSIIDGVFYGTIETKTGGGVYHIESSKRYNGTFKSHSIIYHENDVWLNSSSTSRCAVNSSLHFVDKTNDDSKEKEKIRIRKSAKGLNFPDKRSVCTLYFKVDPYFYKEIYENEGDENHEKTFDFIAAYIQMLVRSTNQIYGKLQFYNEKNTQYYTGLKLAVHRIRIITPDDCKRESMTNSDRALCEQYLDAETMVKVIGQEENGKYCLVYGLTARDFGDSSLGIAYVGGIQSTTKDKTMTGACGNYHNGLHLNIGLITVINYSIRVADSVTILTFAHEVGHSFGANHDPDNSSCAPGELHGGNYIMYSHSNSGMLPNNGNFSKCSKTDMEKFLFKMVNSDFFCFVVDKGPLCGNLVVEEGEECDCGFADKCKDECCNDASSPGDIKCRLKKSKVCSPSQGPCCTKKCEYANRTTICHKKTECIKDVYCSGSSSRCPRNNSRYFIKTENNITNFIKSCNGGTQVCRNGICTGSACEVIRLQQCYLPRNPKSKSVQENERLCHLACRGKITNGTCVDSNKITWGKNPSISNISGYILKPGSPCDGTASGPKGYCDILSRCRTIDLDGPILKIKKFLTDRNSATDFRMWTKRNWWIFILIMIPVIACMVLFIKFCSVYTPSSNPGMISALDIRDHSLFKFCLKNRFGRRKSTYASTSTDFDDD